MIHLTTRERRVYAEIVDIIQAPRTLPEVLAEAYGVLPKLLAVDQGAACISKVCAPEEYEWFGLDVPRELFEAYDTMADYDFIRKAVVARPREVLRDEEMLPHGAMERDMLSRMCRERGLVLEQVMTVLLPINERAHGGLTLYRSRRRPFHDRDRAIFQMLASTLAMVFRSHYLLAEAASHTAALDALFQHEHRAAVLILPPETDLWRTDAVGRLFPHWFSAVERHGGGLPEPLREYLRRTAATLEGAFPPEPWVRRGPGVDLVASLIQVPAERPLWLLALKEVLHAGAIPPAWAALLTPREIEVVERVLRGWSNLTISEDLGCKATTVKKHLQRVFDALGADSRAALISRAQQLP